MNFNKIVKEILSSVLSLFEFALKQESKGIIEFNHKVLSISFTYDFNKSFEVDVNFHFKANNEFYTLAELKEYLDKEKNRFIATQILEEDKLKSWVQEVKVFLEKHLDELVQNHVKMCFEMDGLRKQNVIDYNSERDERFFREDIDKFWKSKDYVGLVALIENYTGTIDGAIKKKYKYAIKKIG